MSTFFPANRPLQILVDGYRWGKPVAASQSVLQLASVTTTPGVFNMEGIATAAGLVSEFEGALKTFKFADRFPLDC
jgi:catalase